MKRRLRLGGSLLALGVVAFFAGHPPTVRADKSVSHHLDNHQYKDSKKCLLTAAAMGCLGGIGGGVGVVKRTMSLRRHAADKRQHSVGGGGGGSGGGGSSSTGDGGRGTGINSDRDADLDQNVNFDYNYYDGGGGGGVGGVGQDGGPDTNEDYDAPPLITDPRDRMLPVIYNPRPMYSPQQPLVPTHYQQSQQHNQQQPPYSRFNEDVPDISPFEVPIIGKSTHVNSAGMEI